MSKATSDRTETRRHLETLYGEVEGFFSVCHHNGRGRFLYEFFATSDLEKAADRIDELAADRCTWISTNPYRSKPKRGSRGTIEDVSALVAVTAEIDFASPHRKSGKGYPNPSKRDEVLARLREVPGISEVSSSGDGFHCWGALADPFEIESEKDRARAIAVVKGWQRLIHRILSDLGSFDGLHNVEKLLRPIGSVHRKGEPKPVASVFRSEARIDFDRLEEILDAAGLLEDDRVEPAQVGELPSEPEIDLQVETILANDSRLADLWTLESGPRKDDGSPDRSEIAWAIACRLAEIGIDRELRFALLDRWQRAHGRKEDLRRLLARSEKAVEATRPEPSELPRNNTRYSVNGTLIAPGDHFGVARTFISERYRDGGFVSWRGEFYRFHETRYLEAPEDAVRAQLARWLSTTRSPARKADDPPKPTAVSSSLVSGVLSLLPSADGVLAPHRSDPPFRLRGTGPEASRLFPVANGLLDLETRELLPPTRDIFAIGGSDAIFDASAPPPERWLRHLEDCFEDDEEAKLALQEWLGYLVSGDARLQKALMLWGPKRSGKGTIGRVIRSLVGEEATASPELSGMHESFALQSLIRARVALVSDALLEGWKSDQARAVERFLTITGGDAITIRRKFLPDVTARISARFVFLVNELPSPSRGAAAFADRFHILRLRRSFFGSEDPNLSTALEAELPGILNWALDGLDRVRAHDRIAEPASSIEARDSLRRITDEGLAFAEDCCHLGKGLAAPKALLFALFRFWRSEVRGEPEDPTRAVKLGHLSRVLSPHGVTFENSRMGPRGSQVPAYRGISIDLSSPYVLEFLDSVEAIGLDQQSRKGLALILNEDPAAN